jgi:hypothetical protein
MKKRVTVDIDVELDAAELAGGFGAILETLAKRIAHAADPLAAVGQIAARDGLATWRVRAFDEDDLTTCLGCGRRVPRSETDIREDGEICRTCALSDQVGAHTQRATEAAYRDGFVDGAGFADGSALEASLLMALLKGG